MKILKTFVSVLLGGGLVAGGLYQATHFLQSGAESTLVPMFLWSMVAILGIFFIGWIGLKYTITKDTTDRPSPPKSNVSRPSRHSKSRSGRS